MCDFKCHKEFVIKPTSYQSKASSSCGCHSAEQSPLQKTQDRMGKHFTSNQVLGRLQPIGCVAVEITQKCNLDCTLCYLSEHSQQVRDIPLQEVFNRLDGVVAHYGTGVPVQITGGDPTLRKHYELIEIVQYASNLGLKPALFTNGIAASRQLLTQLAKVGLCDVAFHVDTTQQRKGYEDEQQLNQIREEYLERARGLGIMVVFNTTIYEGNIDDIPNLVNFFCQHADVIGLVSFQLQAETGRGEWGARDVIVNRQNVQRRINQAVNQQLPWDVIHVGHKECHNYLPTWVINQQVVPIIDDAELFSRFLKDFSNINWDRTKTKYSILLSLLKTLAKKPQWWLVGCSYLARKIKRHGKDLFRSHGRLNKMTFFIQNFMDAKSLDHDRVGACSFMVMTAKGPVSMCQHNAHRDDYILESLKVRNKDGSIEEYEPIKWVKSPNSDKQVL